MKQNTLLVRESPSFIDNQLESLIKSGNVIDSIAVLFQSTGWDDEMEPTVVIVYRKQSLFEKLFK